MAKDYLPIFTQLKDRPCLVVGGGGVAERKVRELLNAGAIIEVVSLNATTGLDVLAANADINLRKGAFQEADLDNNWLVIAATDDRELNTRIALAAERRLQAGVPGATRKLQDLHMSLPHGPDQSHRELS